MMIYVEDEDCFINTDHISYVKRQENKNLNVLFMGNYLEIFSEPAASEIWRLLMTGAVTVPRAGATPPST